MNNYNYNDMNVNMNSRHQELYASMKDECEKAKNDVLRLNSEMVDLKSEIHNQQEKSNNLQRELNGARVEIEKLRNERDNDMGQTSGNDRLNNELSQRHSMEIKSLRDELSTTHEQLQYFRTQWADVKTKYDNSLNQIKERDVTMSDLRLEYENECEKRKSLEKELNIVKDANSKTKMRRTVQQFSMNSCNDEMNGDRSPYASILRNNSKRHSDTAFIASFMKDGKHRSNSVITDVRN